MNSVLLEGVSKLSVVLPLKKTNAAEADPNAAGADPEEGMKGLQSPLSLSGIFMSLPCDSQK